MRKKKFLGIIASIAIVAMIGFAFTACPSGNGGDPEPQDVVVNIPTIGGVTAPASGGIPVTTIAEHAQVTGTIAWASPAGAAGENFAAETVYTATITLTAKEGFTLTGVANNFFTVTGATVTSVGGVVTAVFPVTGPPGEVTTAAIGVTAPRVGVAPATAIATHDQVTGTITWENADGEPADAAFAAETVYTASITITARVGYTLTGLGEDFFTVYGADDPVTSTAPADGEITVTATFPATGAPPLSGTLADFITFSGDGWDPAPDFSNIEIAEGAFVSMAPLRASGGLLRWVAHEGELALEVIYRSHVNDGVDLLQAAFGFRGRDHITVTGLVEGPAQMVLNTDILDHHQFAQHWDASGTFSMGNALSADEAGDVVAGGALRVMTGDGASGWPPGATMPFTITGIEIYRPEPGAENIVLFDMTSLFGEAADEAVVNNGPLGFHQGTPTPALDRRPVWVDNGNGTFSISTVSSGHTSREGLLIRTQDSSLPGEGLQIDDRVYVTGRVIVATASSASGAAVAGANALNWGETAFWGAVGNLAQGERSFSTQGPLSESS